ncbi:MAG: Ycf66 family protein [Trichodesmium sp.]
MLTNILALAVGLGSLALYMVAFFFPEVHRKNDFIWSGVGLFYALVLWFCAGRITGAVLLGQVASVALIGWFGWESLTLRRQVTPVADQTKISIQKNTEDNTQEKSTAIAQTISTPEVESIPKSDLAESTETSVQELENITTEGLINEVKPGETEPELLLDETTSDSSKEIEESEVDTTKSLTEENVLTEARTLPETVQELQKNSSKKPGGFAQLLTPVTGILSNIKNAIQGRDTKNTDSDSKSTKIQADNEEVTSSEEVTSEVNEIISQTEDILLEKEPLTSSEEVTSEVNETISQSEDIQAKQESLMEKEESVISDIQPGETTLKEVEKEASLSSEADSISTEKSISETSALTGVSEVEDSSPSTEKIITGDSDNQEEKVTSVSAEETNEADNLASDLSKDSKNKSVDQ